MGAEAARQGAALIREALASRGSASIIVATGASQFEMLAALVCEELDWSPRDLFMPLRVIVTGRTATPPLFETMEALGKSRCQARLRRGMLALRP